MTKSETMTGPHVKDCVEELTSVQQQIAFDLCKKFHHKVRQAGQDTADLMEAMDIPRDTAVSIVMAELMSLVIGITAEGTTMSSKEFGRICATTLQHSRARMKDKSK